MQETLLRAWRNFDRFEARSSLRSWLYRIATNVCLDMLSGKERRARPMDLAPPRTADTLAARAAAGVHLDRADPRRPRRPGGRRPRGARRVARDDPARVRRRAAAPPASAAGRADPARGLAVEGERGRRAPRHVRRVGQQRAPTRARDARERRRGRVRDRSGRWTTRSARSWLATSTRSSGTTWTPSPRCCTRRPRGRCLPTGCGFGRTTTSAGGASGPGIGCKGSRLVPTVANGSPAYGQYKPGGPEGGLEPWALQVLEISGGRIVGISFFLDTERLFPLFGLPPRLDP